VNRSYSLASKIVSPEASCGSEAASPGGWLAIRSRYRARPSQLLGPVKVLGERAQRLLRLASLLLAAGYFLGLVAVTLAFPYIGERSWIITALLYLPRFGFALPLPVVLLALVLFGPRRLLFALPLALLLLLFPIMGLKLGLQAAWSSVRSGRAATGPVLRILSYNVGATDEPEEVLPAIRAARPDVLLIQEHTGSLETALEEALPRFARHSAGQFSIASRYPIEDVYLPPGITLPGSPPRSARFVRYRLQTPLGPIHVINMHPVSPRNGLEETRGDGLLHELRQGRLARSEGVKLMVANSFLRQRQAEEIAREAARSPHPTLIAGDTNLPEGSWIFRRCFSEFADGWSEVGRGFGYTYPASRPWMRIDRILADRRLAFRGFQVLPEGGSDHRAVLAEVTAR
jgi:vancomycin resistance protein VanJ